MPFIQQHTLKKTIVLKYFSQTTIGNVRKIVSLYFYAIFLEEKKLLTYQWQGAAKGKRAQNLDPYV